MLLSPPHQSPNPNPIWDEQRWIIFIRQALDHEDDLDQESHIPVSIFNVPKSLMRTSPESYVPQLVALGPYHHSRPELYEMEMHKLSTAKRSQKASPGLKLHNLVDQLSRAEHMFRASYHKFLNLNGETLAWMMAVDSCFLLDFFQRKAGNPTLNSGRKTGLHDAILRDIVMLENQIPLFSLKKTLEFITGSTEGADYCLYAMAVGLCRDSSPLMIQESNDVDQINKSAHLLEFLYNLILPRFHESFKTALDDEEESPNKAVPAKTSPFSLIKRLVLSKPVTIILTLPWKIISNLPGILMLKQVEYYCFSRNTEDQNNNNNNNDNSHLLMDEIAIPSVTELSNAGIEFARTEKGIPGIDFDKETATFHLPSLSVDVNSEVVMRNLVAYEACGDASRPLIITRYTELMNGIIDSEEDARILRERGIVWNYLKSDQDVADLWNGMSRSIRMTKVPFLDRVIEDVNSYYNGRWKVRIGKFVRMYVFGSWQSITLMAASMLLFFVSLQSFCTLFGCGRLFFRRTRTY
ncbi:hypothetical protein SASPL_156664 [Salvia splendens]|uniref:Uncharacterized protein n=1 Tax=Salvia splendens TaxID=180675 RepID=A0A8X8YVL3_SALSN|nr:putative UPF0481 protein At3g02645 [Salvia splendens]KAG6383576.1 hypothetical protein SASPL_156664 [Salvia splendens]